LLTSCFQSFRAAARESGASTSASRCGGWGRCGRRSCCELHVLRCPFPGDLPHPSRPASRRPRNQDKTARRSVTTSNRIPSRSGSTGGGIRRDAHRGVPDVGAGVGAQRLPVERCLLRRRSSRRPADACRAHSILISPVGLWSRVRVGDRMEQVAGASTRRSSPKAACTRLSRRSSAALPSRSS
jgi:hypothetical protein